MQQQHLNKAATWGHEVVTQGHITDASRVCKTLIRQLKPAHAERKRYRIRLHVFGGQGNRGVLDLSQFSSQYFHSVSEDLKIKSNTPQVSEDTVQLLHCKTALCKEKVQQRGEAVAEQQTCKLRDVRNHVRNHVHAVWREQNWRLRRTVCDLEDESVRSENKLH